MYTLASRAAMFRPISTVPVRRLLRHPTVRPDRFLSVLQVRAASYEGLNHHVRGRLAGDAALYTGEKNFRDRSLADYRRLGGEINSMQQPNTALRLEHSFASSLMLCRNRKWQFADVTQGLTQLRMRLNGKPHISALEPESTSLIDLDLDWRRVLGVLKKIWDSDIYSYDDFLQRRIIVRLVSYLMFEKSIWGYAEIIMLLQNLQRSEPLPQEKGSPGHENFMYMLKWHMKCFMTLEQHLSDCGRAFTEVLVDRLRNKDHRYWIHDAIFYPFEMSVDHVQRCITYCANSV